MSTENRQLPTEAVLGAPLQIIEDGDEKVVAIRDAEGRFVELKRWQS